jgi:ribosome modulation factor
LHNGRNRLARRGDGSGDRCDWLRHRRGSQDNWLGHWRDGMGERLNHRGSGLGDWLSPCFANRCDRLGGWLGDWRCGMGDWLGDHLSHRGGGTDLRRE